MLFELRHSQRRRARAPRRTSTALAALAVLCGGALLGVAAPADSDTQPAPAGLATLVPNNAGAPSHLKLDAEGSGGGLETGKLPNSLEFAVQNGFTVDPKAVPGVCSNSQADNNACPDSSRFATGTIDLVAKGGGFAPGGSHYTAQLSLYVGEPQQAGDPAGAVFHFIEPSSGFQGSSRGRIVNLSDPTYGTEVRFDKLPLPSLPPGFSFDLQSLKLDIGYGGGTPTPSSGPSGSSGTTGSGTGTTGAHHRKRRRRHSRKKHVFVIRHHAPRRAPATAASATAARAVARIASSSFLTNPAACSGSWNVRLQLGYSDGVQERDASAPCTS